MLDTLRAKLKWLAAMIVACAIAFGAGWYSKKPVEVVKVEEKVIEVVKEKTVEVEKKKSDKVTEITKKPDGTTTTTITESKTEEKTSEKDKAATTEKKATAASKTSVAPASDAYRPNYSIGVAAVAAREGIERLDLTYQIEVGYRVLGNAWATGSYNIQKHQYGLGVRIDF